ncbi:hypothetical protein GCM10028777_00860 [Angustibacter speluncae]
MQAIILVVGDRRSDDVDGLRRVLGEARAVRVFDAGCLHYGPETPDQILSDEPVLVIDRAKDVAELIDLLAVTTVSDVMCMCPVDATVELVDHAGTRLAAVGLHHGSHLRWSDWIGDAELHQPMVLLEWLAARGLGALLDEARRSDLRRDIALAQQATWKAAVPDCVQGLADDMVAAGPWETDLVALVDQAMTQTFPDDVQRSRSLLSWFSAGSGACTAVPAYEELPGRLVASIPIDVVMAALDEEPVDGPVWAGGLRHVAGWKSRADFELRQIPASVWDRLLELANSGNDPDKLKRIRTKHAKFRSPA